MSNKLYILLPVICLVFLVSCVETKEKTDINLLKQTCAELTKNNTEDRIYKPIVGRYLGSKSETNLFPTHTIYANMFQFKMTLKIGNKDIKIYFFEPIKTIKQFNTTLVNITGQSTIKQDMGGITIIGLCVYVKDNGSLLGNIETLKRIKDND